MFSVAAVDLKVYRLFGDQLELAAEYLPEPQLLTSPKLTHIYYSHDNTFIAVLRENQKPQILSSKTRPHLSLAHTIDLDEIISCLCFKSSTKRILALGTITGDVLFYDTKIRDVVKEISHLDGSVRIIEFNSKDDQLAIASDDELHVLQSSGIENNFEKLFALPQTTACRYHRISPNILGTGDVNGTVIVRNTKNNEILAKWHHHSSKVTSIALARYDNIAVTSGEDCRIVIFDYNTMKCIFKINLLCKIMTVDISSDDRYIVTGQEDGSVRVYDFANLMSPVIVELAHASPITTCRFENVPHVTDTCDINLDHVLGDDIVSSHSLISEINRAEYHFLREQINMMLEEKLRTHNKYLQAKFLEESDKFQKYLFNEFYVLHESFAIWDIFCKAKECPQPSEKTSRSYFTLK